MNRVDPAYVEKSIDYVTYKSEISRLLESGLSTGPNQSEALTDYSKMNMQRMKRWDKTFVVNADLANVIGQITRPMTWLVIAEGWCGDAAQNLPGLAKMTDLNPAIRLRLLFRDENVELMDQYLTNGGRSIPKLIAINEQYEVLFTWGPRPEPAQQLFLTLKAEGQPYGEPLHKWYAEDKGQTIQTEFIELLSPLVG